MRIAVDLRPLIEPLPSGITEYTKQIVRQFTRLGSAHDFLLFSNSRQELPAYIRQMWPQTNAEWKVRRWPNKVFNSSLFFTGLPHLDSLVGGADIFFMPNLNFASFTRSAKVVVTVHDLSFLRHGFYTPKGNLWHRCIRPVSLLKRADAIIAVSRATAIDLVDRIPPLKGRVSVIHSGVDEKYFIHDPQDVARVRAKYDLPDSYILFLGTAENRKNLMGLVQAWRMLKQDTTQPVALVIAGKPQEYERFTDPGIKFLGYVPDEDKAGLYNQARIFCYPSVFEGFGLPVLEAMASGTPAITSHATSLAEVIGTAGLMVNPYSIGEIFHGLEQLLNDEPMRKSLGERGKARARQFSWDSAGRKTLDLFSSL